jgi:hypothetical protein
MEVYNMGHITPKRKSCSRGGAERGVSGHGAACDMRHAAIFIYLLYLFVDICPAK